MQVGCRVTTGACMGCTCFAQVLATFLCCMFAGNSLEAFLDVDATMTSTRIIPKSSYDADNTIADPYLCAFNPQNGRCSRIKS